ncbi:MAG TPA: WD40 repeat domain-containing protein, partial [Gemmataceae bacterium]|nr:WD40 repeat domain-containing protein [Gemmataceae bacterium]
MSLRRPICRGLFAIVLFVGIAHAQEKVAQPLRRFGTAALRQGSRIQSLLFLPDGTLLAGGGNEPVRLWNLATGKVDASFADPWTQALALDPTHRLFIAAGALRTIRLHGVGNVDVKTKLENAPAGVRSAGFSPDGTHFLVGCRNGTLLHVSVSFADSAPSQAKIDAHTAEVNAVAWSADGKFAVSGSADRTVRVWKVDGKTLAPIRTIKTAAPVRAVVLGAGDALFEAGDDGTLRMRDLATGDVGFALKGHQGIVQSLALRGTTLVSSSMDGEIRVWDTAKRALVRTIKGNLGDGDALALSVDGKLLAVGGDNGVIRLFDVATGAERRFGTGPTAGLARSVRTAKFLAAIARDGTVHLWNPSTGDDLRTWQTTTTPGVQQEFTLAAHPDGSVLATGTSMHSELAFWNPTGGSLGTLPL